MDKPTRRRSDARNFALPDDKPLPIDREQIAHRAFELFCARGCQDGYDVDDWLSAERDLQVSDNVMTTPLQAPPVPSRDSEVESSQGTQRRERLPRSRAAQPGL